MTPERLQQIEKLFHSALERESAERASFLVAACGGDDSLRRAVESLLTHHEQSESFIESPATAVAAAIFADEPGESLAGQSIGRYEVVELLGAGGMGQVYLAQDTSLGRKVALKLLPAMYTDNADRLRRFEQEARTASALNHPNIVTIYEIGKENSTHFIATEYLDGVTLRGHLATSRMKTSEALDIAVQVASALAAAHAKGVVHRDIKPDNVMVLKESYSLHRENYVKVLDFGIAKLTEAGRLDTEAPTKPLINTNQGVVLGTACYMSPEQARGVAVDARTDIWSLGVVLYEMLAGNIPFDGETAEDVRAAILKDKLQPLAAEIPERLCWIVEKALRKDREDRYQTAREFFSDLRELQQHEFASEALREHSVSPEASVRGSVESGQGVVPSAPVPTGSTSQIAAPPTSSAEYIVGKIKSHKSGVIAVMAIGFVALIALAYIVYRIGFKPKPAIVPFQAIKITKLTNTGNATDAAISPDGKYVAYVIDDEGSQSIWVRHISTSREGQIVPPEAEATYSTPIFSPDGGYVYFLKEKKNELASVLYQVPVLGNASPKKIISDVDGSIAFSPDGKQIAFVRLTTKEESYLMVANSDGSEVRTLATRKAPSNFIAAVPAWSLDAKAIFCAIINRDGNDKYRSVVRLRVADGAEEIFTSQRWLSGIRGLSRLRDGGLVVAGDGQLWYLSYPGGKVRKITNDSNLYRGVSASEDSSLLATIQFGSLFLNIWVESFDKGTGDARPVTPKFGTNGDPSWTHDGKIVYFSNASGNLDIWIMDQDGANTRQLTDNQGQNGYPTLTSDGRYIVFVSDRSGSPHVWRMDNDGGNPKQLTNGNRESSPYCSPDGRWVVYVSTVQTQTRPTLWKVPLGGGNAVQLTDNFSGAPAISPDGKLVACIYFEQGDKAPAKLAIIPIEGGSPVKMFDIPPTAVRSSEASNLGFIRWASDGSAVTYVDTLGGVSNIRSQPLDGRPARQVTDFKSDRIFFFSWSRDGKRLALARGAIINDVALISDSTNQP